MSFESVYIQACNFQEQVIGAEYPSNRTLNAPKAYPASLDTSILPIFINGYGNFNRIFEGESVYEYQGTMVWTLYTAIAGTQESVINQFDTVNWIDTAISKVEAYPFLEISGTGATGLTRVVLVQSAQPLLPNLRYAGNGQQLFWGGRLTLSVNIEIPKDC